MAGKHVIVVGGGNSAGQASLHLAKFAQRVTLLVRGPTLAVSMSEYLISQLAATRNVSIRYGSSVVGVREVDGALAAVRVGATGDTEGASAEELEAGGLFVLIGSAPRTAWLPDDVERDRAGFLITGAQRDGIDAGAPPLALPLETSVPGVFAIGDVRSGSIKRVATAVGDGATVVSMIHGYLAEHPPPGPLRAAASAGGREESSGEHRPG